MQIYYRVVGEPVSDTAEVDSLTEKIAAIDERRAGLISSRDVAIAKARASGATWSALQHTTGLSLRGCQMAADRGRAHTAYRAQ